MRRLALVLLVVLFLVGGTGGLLGQKKGRPKPTTDIPVKAIFQPQPTPMPASDGPRVYSSQSTPVEINGVIAGDEFVLGPGGELTFDFTSPVPGYSSKVYFGPINYGPVGISTQQDTENVNGGGGPVFTKVPLQNLKFGDKQCVQLGYSWYPEGKEYRLVFHRWQENKQTSTDPTFLAHRTSYALVTCTAPEDRSLLCTTWTVEPAVDGSCYPGSTGAIGALWDFSNWQKAYLLGLYYMPHTFTVVRTQ